MKYIAHSLEDTKKIAVSFAENLNLGDVVILIVLP